MKYTVKTIAFDVNDSMYNLQREVDEIEREGFDIVSHSRVRGNHWDEDIFILKPTNNE